MNLHSLFQRIRRHVLPVFFMEYTSVIYQHIHTAINGLSTHNIFFGCGFIGQVNFYYLNVFADNILLNLFAGFFIPAAKQHLEARLRIATNDFQANTAVAAGYQYS